MNNKLTGIVLETSPYQENDLLVRVLTKEHGLLCLLAKGSQKMSAHCHYLPYCQIEFITDLKENRNIYTPRSTRLLKSFYEDTQIKKLAFFNVLSSVTLELKELADETIYNDFLYVLDNTDEKSMYCLGSLFFSEILKKNGVNPMVDGCVVCGNASIIGLSKTKGGFLCRNHAQESDIVEVDRLKKFRLAAKADMSNYEIVKDFGYDSKDFDYLVSFYKENTETVLKSYEFFQKL